MSSSSNPSLIHVVADSGVPTALVSILDSNLTVVASGGGRVEADLSPGIYKVRYATVTASLETIFEASPSNNPLTLPRPNLPAPRAAAVAKAPELFHKIEQTSVALSTQPGLPHGSGSSCFICAADASLDSDASSRNSVAPPHPAAGLKLLTFEGTLIADLGATVPQNSCAGLNVELDPGAYLLRLEQSEGDDVEQTIVTCAGWQTQVLLPLELTSTRTTVRAPNLENATILMSPQGTGLSTNENTSDWVDMARRWLAREEPVAPVAELREAVKEAGNLRGVASDDAALRGMLRDKFTNPMLGIYAAHLLMLSPKPDEGLLREVSTNLKLLLGSHPDVTAIDLWLDPTTDVRPFQYPPMLRNTWKILVNRTRRSEELIPIGSYSLRITGRLWGSGAWLVWCTPPPQVQSQPVSDVDLTLLLAYIRKQLVKTSASQFIRQEAKDKQLTTVESSMLAYVTAVVQGQNAAKKLGDELQKIRWLGPLSSLYRKLSPSELELKGVRNAQAFLQKDSVVEKLGIPQAAVTEAALGLFQKFGLKSK